MSEFHSRQFLRDVVEGWEQAVQRGAWSEALEVIERAIAALPAKRDKHTDFALSFLHVYKGTTFSRLKQWRAGASSCIKALRVDPEYLTAWKQLGRILMRAGKIRWAINCFRKSITIYHSPSEHRRSPSTIVNTYVDLAQLERSVGNRRECVALLREAKEMCCSEFHPEIEAMLAELDDGGAAST